MRIVQASFALLSVTAGLVFLAAGCGNLDVKESGSPGQSPPAGITDVEKPAGPFAPAIGPRVQPDVPKGFTEVPYSEKPAAVTFTREEIARGFMLFTRPITQPVYRTSIPSDAERMSFVSSFATLDEYEPVTFSVHALRDIHNLRVLISDLRSGDHVIGKDRFDLRLATEWNMRYPSYNSKGTYRRLPELLEAVTVNSFAKGTSQRYWATLHVPPDAQPGLYTGYFTVFDDESATAVRLPIRFRVLGYTLQRDPAKRYSVYYYNPDYQFRGMTGDLLTTAARNEYAAMRRYGLDMFPTIPLHTRKGADGKTLDFHIPHPWTVDQMIAAGFQGPIPLAGGIWEFYKKHVPGGKIADHWLVDKQPANDDIYIEIEEAARRFVKECRARGWPELVCCPMDEVAPGGAEFAAKVHAAIRRGGMKTFMTKDPTSADAEVYRRHDAVDIWCPSLFSMPYEQVTTDPRYEYWCYPNHVAGQTKDRATMQKGGRMTYGFGFWRSGFTTLIPWHWRWIPYRQDQFNYLGDPDYSGTGNRMDEQGNVIPAIYWECFREGYDDARYLYTLQQAIYDRRDTTDRRCGELLTQGRTLIQNIWDSTTPQARYLADNVWADEQFTVVRWRMAKLLDELLRYPATNLGQAPSVMADTSRPPASRADAFDVAAEQGVLEKRDLGEKQFDPWRTVTSEVTLRTIDADDRTPPRHVMRMDVRVDHRVDGGGESGDYPIGWPRIHRDFKPDEVVLTDYDYLTFNVKIDSDRDDVAAESTPCIVTFASFEGGHAGFKGDIFLDLGAQQRTWVPIRIPIREVIRRSNRDDQAWRHLQRIQLVIEEARYRDNTHLRFDLDQIELVRVRHPVIDEVQCADTFLLPNRCFPVNITGIGMSSAQAVGDYRLIARWLDPTGKLVDIRTVALSPQVRVDMDHLQNIAAGVHVLEATIVDQTGQVVSTQRKNIQAIAGYGDADP